METEELILEIVRDVSAKSDDLKDEHGKTQAMLAVHETLHIGHDRRLNRMERFGIGIFSALLIAALTVGLSGCGLLSSLGNPPPAPPAPSAPKIDVVARAVKNTVALQDYEERRFCSGVAAEGTIVTAFHCVDGDEPFQVLYKGQAFPATVTLTLPERDLAFVDAVGARLKDTVPLAEKSPVLGSKVIWTGYPLGLDFIMGLGIVGNPSYTTKVLGEGDWLAVYGQFIPGNSGGPVFNSKGALIGIISKFIVGHGAPWPVGIAIPHHTLKDHLH